MEKSNFDRLLQRYLSDQVSEKERIKIEAWLEEVKTDDPTSLELTKEDEEKVFQKITNSIENSSDPFTHTKQTTFRPWLIGIAATVVLLSIGFVLWYNGRPSVDKMILTDGTLVWLKGESKLIYYEKASEGTRNAELTGAALFEVTKDASRPFVLTCGDFKIKVLGTSFSVKTVPSGLEIEVLTGKVNLSSAKDSVGIEVESNQRVIYSGQGSPNKEQLDPADVSTIIDHTEYDMHFEGAPLKNVFERIEKKFGVTVKTANTQIESCKITADFTDHSLESTLTMIAEVLAIEYEVVGKKVTVSGSGCN